MSGNASGKAKDSGAVRACWLGSIGAGMCISLGCIAYVRVGGALGAFLFSIGLFFILFAGFELFTGKACYLYDTIYSPKEFKWWPLVWFGNLCGTMFFVVIYKFCGFDVEPVKAIAEAKMELPLWQLFFRAALCNACIFIAVRAWKDGTDGIIKYGGVVLGVMVFVLCGFEHCVADMFYLAIHNTRFRPAMGRLLVVTAGNIVGAWLMGTPYDAVKRLQEGKI